MDKVALILGCGQDGSYLAEILLEKGYQVHVMHRKSSCDNLWRLKPTTRFNQNIHFHLGDMADSHSVAKVINEVSPDEIYNMADQDSVTASYTIPAYNMDITAGAVARTLETIRYENKRINFFQPVSATMFGDAPPSQTEETKFKPQSPYACAKVAAYYLCQHYRREYNMHVTTGIMYNHDSVRRQGDYLLHQICRGAVEIQLGRKDFLTLGCLDARVDIGDAREYMEAVYDMMQLDYPDDFIISSGAAWTISDMVAEALEVAGVKGKVKDLVKVDQTKTRPGGTPTLIGAFTKANKAFGFAPKVRINQIIEQLVDHYKRELTK